MPVPTDRHFYIDPARCIHTHPIKRDSDIRDALRFGVTTFVADNPDEIRKFVRYRKRAELLLRVCFRSPTAVCDLSKKFGCEPGAVLGLIEQARRRNVLVYPVILAGTASTAFADLARVTGGRLVVVRDGARLGTELEQIATELRAQYLLGYSPELPPPAVPTWRTITVAAERPGLTVRAREGYLAR